MSLSVNDPLKNNLEETVTREFLLATGSPYRILRAGIPPEPDQLYECPKTGRQVGIEVVSVYYDQNHAKSVWMQARTGKSYSYEISRKDSVENIRLLAETLRRIRAKSRKRYTPNGRLILVVFTYLQRLYLCDIEERLTSLHIPSNHPFDEINIMSQHGEVYRLFPDNSWLLR